MEVTTFKSRQNANPVEQTTLAKVLSDIKGGKWKARIEKVHADIKNKDWLPCFTPTGRFNYRSINGMEEYNGIICLDIDHVDDAEALREVARGFDWVHAAYITPSGHGLKVIVKTNSKRESYTWAERVVAMMFEDQTGFARDNRCKDIARIQYISYDPDLVYNEDSKEVDIWSPFDTIKAELETLIKLALKQDDLKKMKNYTKELDQLLKDAGKDGTQF